jgi:hypothetical protein
MKLLLKIIISIFFLNIIVAQASEEFQNEDSINDLPNVFIFCPYCDMSYIKKEIKFVNFTNHPTDAEIKVLITTQSMASGGESYLILFESSEKYNSKRDTIRYISKLNEPEVESRQGLTKKIILGLLGYIKDTPLIDDIEISYENSGKEAEVKDKWDSWVFTISANGYLSGEKSSNSSSYWTGASVGRITEDLKLNLDFDFDYSESNYDYESTVFKSVSRSFDISSYSIFSLDSNLSAGLFGNIGQSTYSNTDMEVNLTTGLEYNIFPYSLSSNRYLSFIYRIGYKYNKYFEETIYDKIFEHLATHSFEINYLVKETWGSISASFNYSNYLNDFSKRRMNLYSSLSFYVTGGLSLSIGGYISMINDQIYLVKGSISQEDLLLRRKAIRTNYSYNMSLGLSYTFGSIFNNVVNPRFRN